MSQYDDLYHVCRVMFWLQCGTYVSRIRCERRRCVLDRHLTSCEMVFGCLTSKISTCLYVSAQIEQTKTSVLSGKDSLLTVTFSNVCLINGCQENNDHYLARALIYRMLFSIVPHVLYSLCYPKLQISKVFLSRPDICYETNTWNYAPADIDCKFGQGQKRKEPCSRVNN